MTAEGTSTRRTRTKLLKRRDRLIARAHQPCRGIHFVQHSQFPPTAQSYEIVLLQGTHNNWIENQIRPIAIVRQNWPVCRLAARRQTGRDHRELDPSSRVCRLSPEAEPSELEEHRLAGLPGVPNDGNR